MCPNCRAFITTKDKVCPYCEMKLGPRAIDRRMPSDVLGGLIPAAQFTTIVILIINFGLYLVTAVYSMRVGNSSGFMSLDPQTLYLFGAKYTPAIFVGGQWWRLVTAGFLHGGVIHILMNSWVLYDLGDTAEKFFGMHRMLVIYFVSTVTGFLASSFWSASVSIGASAALMGLIGAMIAFGMHDKTGLGSAVKAMAIRWAIYVLLFGFILSGMIDNAAHIGGLAGGFAVAWFAGTPRLVDDAKEKFWKYAAYVCIALTVGCFLQWYMWFAQVTKVQ